MWATVLQFVTAACRHRHLSQPFSSENDDTRTIRSSHYVVCLECGRHFGYDWDQMRLNWTDNSARHAPQIGI
jgi:hypothetical protein